MTASTKDSKSNANAIEVAHCLVDFLFHYNKICQTYSYTAVSQHKEAPMLRRKNEDVVWGQTTRLCQLVLEKKNAKKKKKKKNIFVLLQKQQRSEDLYRIDGKEPQPPQWLQRLTFDLLTPYLLPTGTEPPHF